MEQFIHAKRKVINNGSPRDDSRTSTGHGERPALLPVAIRVDMRQKVTGAKVSDSQGTVNL